MTRSALSRWDFKPDPLSAGFTSKCWPILNFGVNGSIALQPNPEPSKSRCIESADHPVPAIDSIVSIGGGSLLRYTEPLFACAIAISLLAAGSSSVVVIAQTAPMKQKSNRDQSPPVGNRTADQNLGKRPITAGGFVDSGPVIFEDITKPAGLSA